MTTYRDRLLVYDSGKLKEIDSADTVEISGGVLSGLLQVTPGATSPSQDGQIRYVTGQGFKFYEEGAVKTIASGGGGTATLQSAYDAGASIALSSQQLLIYGTGSIALTPAVIEISAADTLWLAANDAAGPDIRIGTGSATPRQISVGSGQAPVMLGTGTSPDLDVDASSIGYKFTASAEKPSNSGEALAFDSAGNVTQAMADVSESLANVIGVAVEDAPAEQGKGVYQRVATMHGSIVPLRFDTAPTTPGETVYLDPMNPGWGTVTPPSSTYYKVKLGVVANTTIVLTGSRYYIVFHPELVSSPLV